MPTADPITTDRLVAAIREGMADQPLLTSHARPVADRLAALIRKRLPNIPAAEAGELMIHLAAYFSTEIAALSSAGETPQSAILVATSGAAVAGLELYDNGEQPRTAPTEVWYYTDDDVSSSEVHLDVDAAKAAAITAMEALDPGLVTGNEVYTWRTVEKLPGCYLLDEDGRYTGWSVNRLPVAAPLATATDQ